MAEEEEVPAAAEELPHITLKVRIESCRNLPEGVSTIVSYNYALKRLPEGEEAEEDSGESEEYLKAASEEFEEPPENTQHTYNLETDHQLPEVNDEMLYRLITAPLEIKLYGKKILFLKTQTSWTFFLEPLERLGWYKVNPDGEIPPAENEDTPAPVFPDSAEVFVWLQLSKLLIPREEVSSLNIVTINLKSLHQLPPKWFLQPEQTEEEYLYNFALQYSLPASGHDTPDIVVTAEPGTIVAAYVKPPDPDPPETEDRGAGEGGDGAQGEQVEVVKEVRAPSEQEEDVPEKIQKTSAKASSLAERKAPKVVFEHSFTTCMRPDAIAKLKKIIEARSFKVDVSRSLRSGDEYVYARKYHGVANPDFSNLTAPDQTSLVLRCLVSGADDFAFPTEEELAACPPPGDEPEEDETGNPYTLARTYLVMSISTLKPLVPKQLPPKPVLPKVGDLVPTRPPAILKQQEKNAYDVFSDEIREVIEGLADEYADMFMGSEAQSLTPDGADLRRQQAIFQLNATGRYYDFKEKLASAVSRIMKERFQEQRQKTDISTADGKRFLSDLYVELQTKVNRTMNAIFNPSARTAKGAEAYTEEQLAKVLREELRLAHEAELNRDFVLAAQHLNQRVILCPADHTLWCDYGAMCVRSGNWPKAEECLREAVALDPRHVLSLISYAILLCLMDNWTNAETYLRGAVDFEPNNIQAWALLVLYYDMESRDLDRRAALKRVLEIEDSDESVGRESAYMRAGTIALSLNASPLALRASMQETSKRGATQQTRLMTARAYLASGEFAKCCEAAEEALAVDKRLAEAMNVMANSYYMQHGWPTFRSDVPMPSATDAITWFVKAAEARRPYIDEQHYIRLGKLYLASCKWYEAKEAFLHACKREPSATTWLGLGIACLSMNDVSEAEEALSEGNILDSKNAEIWGMLVITCMKQGKTKDAEEAFGHAASLGLGCDETFPLQKFIVQQIGDEFFGVGMYSQAMAAYRRGLSTDNPSPTLCKALAQSLYHVNDLNEAVKAFSLIVDSPTAPDEHKYEALQSMIELSRELNKVSDVKKYENMLNLTPVPQYKAL